MNNQVRNEPRADYTATPEWEAIPGTGMDEDDVIDLARRIIQRREDRRRSESPRITSADAARAVIGTEMAVALSDRKNEVFGVTFLDTRHRMIANEELFMGTVDGAAVYPRVVVQRALEINAAAIVIYHNHPSGEPEPSQADLALTRRLREALGMVDVTVLDHLVVGSGRIHSMAETGQL